MDINNSNKKTKKKKSKSKATTPVSNIVAISNVQTPAVPAVIQVSDPVTTIAEDASTLSISENNENNQKPAPEKLEYSFVMIKPDAVQRKLVGKIVSRLEDKGLQPLRFVLGQATKEIIEQLYEEHRGKSFFDANVNFICSGTVIISVWVGQKGIVQTIRDMVGSIKQPGTIRGDYSSNIRENCIHASDSVEAAKREIKTFFTDFPDELL